MERIRQQFPNKIPVSNFCVLIVSSSVVVKDLRLEDKDKDKDLMSEDEDEDKDLVSEDEDKDKDLSSKDEDEDKDLMSEDEDEDKDLKIGPRGSSRTRTFLEDNNTGKQH